MYVHALEGTCLCVEFAYACMNVQVLKSIRQSTEIKMNCHYSENLKVFSQVPYQMENVPSSYLHTCVVMHVHV